MPVQIHGKSYRTVAERLKEFIDNHPKSSIETEIIMQGEGCLAKAKITARSDKDDNVRIATGHAFETQGSSGINKTSHIENAETSAVGRALAFLGYSGDEIASADEVAGAINQSGSKAPAGEPRPAEASKFGQGVVVPPNCAGCDAQGLDEAVVTYSVKWYGKVLCRDCQKKNKRFEHPVPTNSGGQQGQ